MLSSSKEAYRSKLRSSICHLSDRYLFSATKWAAELLVRIDADTNPSSISSSSSRSQIFRRHFRSASAASADVSVTPAASVSYVSTPVPIDDFGGGDGDAYLLAKSYFDCREYRRATNALRGQIGKKAVFLRCYALYLYRLEKSVKRKK